MRWQEFQRAIVADPSAVDCDCRIRGTHAVAGREGTRNEGDKGLNPDTARPDAGGEGAALVRSEGGRLLAPPEI